MQRQLSQKQKSETQRSTYGNDSIMIIDSVYDDDQRFSNMSYIYSEELIIPQVHIEQIEQIQPTICQMPLVIQVIVTSQKQICSVRVKIVGSSQQQKSIYNQSRYSFENNDIVIFCIRTSIEQLMNLKVQIQQKQRGLLGRKSKKEYNLFNLIIHEEAGLHFDQLIQRNSNIMLQNYCILAAQQHLTKNLKKLNKDFLVPQFYKIFKDCFNVKLEKNNQVFRHYKPSDMNTNISEFFIYFFFTIFKNRNPKEKIIQFDVLKKLKVQKISKIRDCKFYRLFKNWKPNLDFLFYCYFEACLIEYEDKNNFIGIIQWNILNQQKNVVQQMVSKLTNHEHCLFPLLNENKINNIIVNNENISFVQYMNWKIKYVQHRLTKYDEDISQLLMRFIEHVVQKAKLNNQNIDLSHFKYKIFGLFVLNQKLRQELDAVLLYNKLKAKYRYHNQIGSFFIETLKSYILCQLPKLLIDKFELTIISLVVKPQIAQQNSILLNHFQRQHIQEQQLVFIFRIWQQMKHEEYNINVIQFVILKFVAFNPHFNITFLRKIIQIFKQQQGSVSVNSQCKKNIPLFCGKILNQIKTVQMRNVFGEWMQQMRRKSQQDLYQTIIID